MMIELSYCMPASSRARLEKAAYDNGFDLPLSASGAWISFASSKCSLVVWLAATVNSGVVLGVSRKDVGKALQVGTDLANLVLLPGMEAARAVDDAAALHRALRRAFQLARSLPDAPLAAFVAATAHLPRTTEAERMVVQRVGQGLFRASLIEYWEGRCAVTGLAVPALLRASHAKPWAMCESDSERLDVFNGLLLAPNVDACFDAGLLAIAPEGKLMVSQALDVEARALLGLAENMCVSRLQVQHEPYLAWHRSKVFSQAGSP